jgi:hypothetical protein
VGKALLKIVSFREYVSGGRRKFRSLAWKMPANSKGQLQRTAYLRDVCASVAHTGAEAAAGSLRMKSETNKNFLPMFTEVDESCNNRYQQQPSVKNTPAVLTDPEMTLKMIALNGRNDKVKSIFPNRLGLGKLGCFHVPKKTIALLHYFL